MTPNILVVDDDPDVLTTLSRVLSREGYEVGKASSATDAKLVINQRRPDLLILDVLMSPGMDGLALCRQLRADERFVKLPILFLTARSKLEDVVDGLDSGGDDYLPKPFQINELTARVRALLRRTQQNIQELTSLEVNGFRLDLSSYQISISDQSIQLTATEIQLLRYLMEHVNQVIPAPNLLKDIWGYPSSSGSSDLVRSHVRNLRVKLAGLPGGNELIRTVHGVGYMIVA